MGKYGTAFQESEAILAASADDFAHLDQIVRAMDPGELAGLARSAECVVDAAHSAHLREGQS